MALPKIVGGYDLAQFAENQDLEKYACAICTSVRKETTSLPCNHFFCRECIGRWVVTGHKSCPYCRANFNGHMDMKTTQPDSVQYLQTKCTNAGCMWTGALGKRNEHRKNSCEKEDRRIACASCKFYGETEAYTRHQCPESELRRECLMCRNLLEKSCIMCTTEAEYNHQEQLIVCNHGKQACNHAFHDHCLSRWMRKHPSCPLCDGPLVNPLWCALP